MNGLYSEVQAVVSDLVELLAPFDPQGAKSSVLGREKKQGLLSFEQKGGARPANVTHRLGDLDPLNLEAKTSEILLQKPGQTRNSMDPSLAHSSEERKEWIREADLEAFSLIMEADVFAYLRSRSEQYKRILLSHGVHVVDVTSEGVATLYLQSDAKAKTKSEAVKHMRQARKELSHLYQQLEGNLRRAQIYRSALGLRGGNTEEFKELQALLPKVLLNYDQTYVYIVGESSEVSQAKQILLLGSGTGQESIPTTKKASSSQSNIYDPACESETFQMTQGGGEPRAAPLKTSADERRWKGGEEYKLAARFKNSEIGLPGFYSGERGRGRELQGLTTSMNTLGLASSSEPRRSSLGTTGAVHGNKAGVSQELLMVTGVNRTEDDILFQKMDPLSFMNTFKTKANVDFTSTSTPTFSASPSTSQSGHDEHTLSVLRTAPTSKSPLKRANSFSGRPSQREEIQKTGTHETSGFSIGTNKMPKSHSLSSGKPAVGATREVAVLIVMWNYMKQAYRSHLDDLTSDLQVTESLSDKDKVRVILKGSELSKVENCQSKLQKLVGMVASDFCVQKLRLADLGVTESSEVFKTCCSNIRSRFPKISLRNAKDTVILIGPKPQCSQATELFKEVFLQDVSNPVPHGNTITHQGTIDQGQVNIPADQAQFQSNRQIRSNQSNTDRESFVGHSINQALSPKGCQLESWNVSCIQSLKQKPALRGQRKNGEPGELETVKTGTLPNQSSEPNEVLVGLKDDRSKAHSLTAQKKQKATTLTLKQTNLQVCNRPEQCVCRESGASVARTSCGVFLHSTQCMVCSKEKERKEPSPKMLEEQTPEELTGKEAGGQKKQVQGIQGTMTYVELPLSLPGYSRYTTAKITYCIPDGIQGVWTFSSLSSRF